MSESKNQRKSLFIDKPFQTSFLIFTIGIAVFVSVLYFITFHIFFWYFKHTGIELGLSENHIFFRFLDEQRFTLDIIFLISTVIVSIFLFIYGLFMSNRIAGPIYKLKKYLNEFENGKEEIAFRENDYFKDLEVSVNLALQKKNKNNGN